MSTNVLVTGATGFVGRHLTAYLNERSDLVVRALARRGGCIGKTPVAAVDLSDAEAVRRWSETNPELSVVFHLAADVPTTLPDDPSVLERNIRSTLGAVALATRCQAHLVYVSSAFVYDP